MSDPQHLDWSDWAQIAVGSVLSGVGGAMAWFRGEKKELVGRMTKLEGAMKCYDASVSEHQTGLAVLKTLQDTTADRLDEITLNTRDTNERLVELSSTMTNVLLAIQQNRRL